MPTGNLNPQPSTWQRASLAAVHILWVCLLCIACSTNIASAHGEPTGKGIGEGGKGGEEVDYNSPEPGGPGYDETSIFINVQRIGGMEIPAVIKNRQLYLPVTHVFDFLKIKNTSSIDLNTITGFFIDQAAVYTIDNTQNQITYQGKTIQLRPDDMIVTETNLYLRQDYFNHVFGLTTSFDFSNLTLKMSASFDLPAVKEMQLQQMHQAVNRMKGVIAADTVIGRSYHMFRMGLADWAFNATQQSDGLSNVRGSLALGAMIAGGEANVVLNYNSQEKFSERQQFYQWRFANNDRKAMRQVTLGRIFTQATSSIFDPVIGVQVTNTPTTYRRSFGTYRLSRMTQPGWTVELYVNNVLVDYTKSDASGFFSFEVPLVYGNSVVRLRYYGLYGEVRTSEENIAIPFNFLPKGELEYTASAGFVSDGSNSRFGRGSLSYGVSRKITVGAGAEYLSSLGSRSTMPFVNASVRLSSDLMVSGDYTHGVRGRGMLTYRLPLNAQFELNYTKYAKGQTAIIYNFMEERKAVLTLPFRGKKFSAVTRLMYNQTILTTNTNYTTAEWLVSGTVRNISANINTYMISTAQYDPPKFDPYIYSNASLSFRFKNGFILTPQAQYSYKDNQFISVKAEVEKFMFNKGFLNVAFEQNFKSNLISVSAGLRYDLSFARFGITARQSNGMLAVTESVSGSLLYDRNTSYLGFNNRPGLGRAGITILPYLDINGNGRRDAGEPKVAGLKVKINSGRIEYSNQDTMIRLSDLEPYNTYFVDISQNSFEFIGWQVRNKTMNIAVDPNHFKLIEVPVTVVGEASGMVYMKGEKGTRGQGRIKVCFYREDANLAGCTTTDPDGYYSYIGLTPGTYTVRPDGTQLENLHMTATPASSVLTLKPSREGDIVEGLDFTFRVTEPVDFKQ